MNELNQEISKEATILGKGFRIGHSYFCCGLEDGTSPDTQWLNEIVMTDIALYSKNISLMTPINNRNGPTNY